MNVKRHEGHEREAPNSHLYHALLPIIFILLWFLDSQVFRFSTFLNKYAPPLIRLILFIIVFAISIAFIILYHRKLFKKHQPSNNLITNGILRYVRNPMYFGILLIYVAFLILSISLIGIGLFIVVFLVYNWMVNYEEKILEDIFGDEYREYKSKVPKWIPNPFRKIK
ncbi:MAG: isoprenylcysteine carboxylmethyltransferase family protein [Candidatus Lokiarchaeia archaeon]|nr:isoprenylcysteine carboxylmethyltransferase family protein [Candidatus Lokiarchaeia archaeon]